MSNNSVSAPPTFRPGPASALFVSVMVGAAVFSMLRMIAAAWYMPLTDFANYTAIVATAAFLSTILSFGTIEATVKKFPRLTGEGREADILPTARRIMKWLAARALSLGVPVLAIGFLLDLEWLKFVGIAFLFSLNTSYTGMLASMQRAAGTAASQAQGTLLRSVGVLCAVTVAARYGDLTVVLVAEAAATFVACFLSEWFYFHRRFGTSRRPAIWSSQSRKDGVLLFLTYSCVSMPFYLDRLFVTTVLGTQDGAEYAVLAVFLTGASVLVSTLSQRSGPQAIRLVQRDGSPKAAVRQILTWCLVAGILWLSAMGIAATAVAADILPLQLARYFSNSALLIPVTVSGLLLTTGLIEFLFVALDRERLLLRAAGSFAIAVLVAAGTVTLFNLDLLAFMWLLAACRAFYLVLLFAALPWGPEKVRGVE